MHWFWSYWWMIQTSTTFVALVAASWCVGEGGEILGEKYDASVVGGLVIAWLNTLPEAMFFLSALRAGDSKFAVGAISGSAITVCTVAVGLCIVFGASARPSKTIYLQPSVRKQCLFLAGTVLGPLYVAMVGYSGFAALFGVVAYLAFLYFSIVGFSNSSSVVVGSSAAGGGKVKVDEEESQEESERLISKQATPTSPGQLEAGPGGDDGGSDGDDDEGDEHGDEPAWIGMTYLVVGAFIIYMCAEPFINGVSMGAEAMDVSPVLLAFFLAPLASEAPEILESISLSRKGKVSSINVAVANLMGGTVSKTTLLLGLLSFYGLRDGLEWDSPEFPFSLTMVAICAFASASIGFSSQAIPITRGYYLFALYAFVGVAQYVIGTIGADEVVQDAEPPVPPVRVH